MLVYYMDIWSIIINNFAIWYIYIQLFGIFYGYWVYFPPFWWVVSRKIWQPCDRAIMMQIKSCQDEWIFFLSHTWWPAASSTLTFAGPMGRHILCTYISRMIYNVSIVSWIHLFPIIQFSDFQVLKFNFAWWGPSAGTQLSSKMRILFSFGSRGQCYENRGQDLLPHRQN
jgi:hypothetical protein